MNKLLNGKTIIVTGAARHVGKIFALVCAQTGANVAIYYENSEEEAESVMVHGI